MEYIKVKRRYYKTVWHIRLLDYNRSVCNCDGINSEYRWGNPKKNLSITKKPFGKICAKCTLMISLGIALKSEVT